jgi:hypothetical protein
MPGMKYDIYIPYSKKEDTEMKGLAQKLETMFMAITFAEAGEFDAAREILSEGKRDRTMSRPEPTLRNRAELRASDAKR